MSDEKVFCIPELRLYILSYMIEPDACLKCGVSDKSYYIYSHDYPKYCIWCSPNKLNWREKVLNYNKKISLLKHNRP